MICHKCGGPAKYAYRTGPLCFKCICEIEIPDARNRVLLKISKCSMIPVEVIKSKTRKREVVYARYIYYFICKKTKVGSLQHIASLTGQDHATVLHGIDKVETHLKTDREFINKYSNFISQFLNENDKSND